MFYYIPKITGVAWLSSARVVRCRVNSYNERNFGVLNIPLLMVHSITTFYIYAVGEVPLLLLYIYYGTGWSN